MARASGCLWPVPAVRRRLLVRFAADRKHGRDARGTGEYDCDGVGRTYRIICALSTLLLIAGSGCDRDTSSQGGGGQTTETDTNVAGPVMVELAPITPLLPRLRTHVAVDGHGNLYWVQESEPAPPPGG